MFSYKKENSKNIINMIYKCERCHKQFEKKSHYNSHINRKNKCTIRPLSKVPARDKIKELKCPVCDTIYSRSDVLKKHQITCTDIKLQNAKNNDIRKADVINNKGTVNIDQSVTNIYITPNIYINLINFDTNFNKDMTNIEKMSLYLGTFSDYIKCNPNISAHKLISFLLHSINLDPNNIDYHNVYISDNKKNMTAHVFNLPKFEKRNNDNVVNQILSTYSIYAKYFLEQILLNKTLNDDFKNTCTNFLDDMNELINDPICKRREFAFEKIKEELFSKNEYGRAANDYIRKNPLPKPVYVDPTEKQLEDEARAKFAIHKLNNVYIDNYTIDDFLNDEYHPARKRRENAKECKERVNELLIAKRIEQLDAHNLIRKINLTNDYIELFLLDSLLSRKIHLYKENCDLQSLSDELALELKVYNYLFRNDKKY